RRVNRSHSVPGLQSLRPQPRQRSDDLPSAAQDDAHQQEVDQVSTTQPERKVRVHHAVGLLLLDPRPVLLALYAGGGGSASAVSTIVSPSLPRPGPPSRPAGPAPARASAR